MKQLISGFATLCLLFVLFACQHPQKKNSTVTIHFLADPGTLNPLNYNDASSSYVLNNIYQSLMAFDHKTLKRIPWLAQAAPEKKQRIGNAGMEMTFHIRPEARFDESHPVTAADVLLTMKIIKNPKTNCERIRSSIDFLEDVITYPEDPLKVTFLCTEHFNRAESMCSDFYIMPKYLVDPNGYMDGFSFRLLNTKADSLAEIPNIKAFADDFNSAKFQNDTAFIKGSGAYTLSDYKTGQQITLTRKANWWGESFKEINYRFSANPSSIVYRIINDQGAALIALKNGSIDLMYGMRPKDFIGLMKDSGQAKKFNFYNPRILGYAYIGLNNRNPILADKRVRKAIAHLVDEQKIVDNLFYSLCERVIGPINPAKGDSYNHDLKPVPFDPAVAAALLKEAGWEDTDGNGVLDKIIDGKKMDLSLNFLVNTGSEERKQVALMFKEAAEKVGMEIRIEILENSVCSEMLNKHNFDMNYGARITVPGFDDLKNIYHSTSLNSGNFFGYSNPVADALIDSMRLEPDEQKYNSITKRLQEVMYEDAPVVFLHTGKERIVISKRFSNINSSELRPGFWEAGFEE